MLPFIMRKGLMTLWFLGKSKKKNHTFTHFWQLFVPQIFPWLRKFLKFGHVSIVKTVWIKVSLVPRIFTYYFIDPIMDALRISQNRAHWERVWIKVVISTRLKYRIFCTYPKLLKAFEGNTIFFIRNILNFELSKLIKNYYICVFKVSENFLNFLNFPLILQTFKENNRKNTVNTIKSKD